MKAIGSISQEGLLDSSAGVPAGPGKRFHSSQLAREKIHLKTFCPQPVLTLPLLSILESIQSYWSLQRAGIPFLSFYYLLLKDYNIRVHSTSRHVGGPLTSGFVFLEDILYKSGCLCFYELGICAVFGRLIPSAHWARIRSSFPLSISNSNVPGLGADR